MQQMKLFEIMEEGTDMSDSTSDYNTNSVMSAHTHMHYSHMQIQPLILIQVGQLTVTGSSTGYPLNCWPKFVKKRKK